MAGCWNPSSGTYHSKCYFGVALVEAINCRQLRLFGSHCAAESPEEIDDVESQFRLIEEGLDEAELRLAQLSMDDGGRHSRRPQKSSRYKQYKAQGLHPFVSYVGLRAGQLAANLDKGYREHEVQDPAKSPEDVADTFIYEYNVRPQLSRQGF